MKLYVMRHGPAEDFAPSGRDGDRALTTSGRERVRAVAKLLATESEAPRMIVSSPLVRAMQTAEIVAAELGIDNVETGHELAPGGDAAVLARALLRDERKRPMLVGHEPDLSTLVATLLDEPFDTEMLKAMVVGLQLKTDEKTRLRFVLDPKTLRLDLISPNTSP
jgi:phosphohistidine phosphatase